MLLHSEQLEEAAEEFARFSAYMKPAPSSLLASTVPSAASQGDMPDLLDLETEPDKPRGARPA